MKRLEKSKIRKSVFVGMSVIVTVTAAAAAAIAGGNVIYGQTVSSAVVGDSRLHGLFCQYRTMDLVSGQTIQSFGDRFVGQLQSLVYRLTFDHLGGHAAGCNGTAAAEGVELYIGDHIVVNFQVDFHDVTALGVAHFADAVCVINGAQVAGVQEMIHNFITV